jgi:hypothetical protein
MQTTYPFSSHEDTPVRVHRTLLPQPFKLTVACQGSKYVLALEQMGIEQAQVTCSAEHLTIMPPVGGAFAGVMYGIYASGRGEAVLDPADFTDIGVVSQDMEMEQGEDGDHLC